MTGPGATPPIPTSGGSTALCHSAATPAWRQVLLLLNFRPFLMLVCWLVVTVQRATVEDLEMVAGTPGGFSKKAGDVI